MDLKIGDVLRLRNVRHYLEDGKSWTECVAAKGKVLVVQILGVEPQVLKSAEEALDPVKVLDQMGWQPKKPKKAKKSNLVRKSK